MKFIVPPFINSLVDDLTKPRRRRITEKEFEAIINRRLDRWMMVALFTSLLGFAAIFILCSSPKVPAERRAYFDETDADFANRASASAMGGNYGADRDF